MLKGTYVGPLEHLKGQEALLQRVGPNYLAQFDATNLSIIPGVPGKSIETNLGFGWTFFLESNFKLHRKVNWDQERLDREYDAVLRQLDHARRNGSRCLD